MMTSSVNSVLPLLIYCDREDLHELDETPQNKSELKHSLFIQNFIEIIITTCNIPSDVCLYFYK